ncbi:hypothetical protein ABZ707_04685 [Streptomyces sp. NPDC006923]
MTRLTRPRPPGDGYSRAVRGPGQFVVAIEAFATTGETDGAR